MPGMTPRSRSATSSGAHVNREVRKLGTRPDLLRKYGAHASDETRQRRQQQELEDQAQQEIAEKSGRRHREDAVTTRLTYAEKHWQELSTKGQRKNPHLAARLIYTKLALAATYTASTGTVPADLRTPATIATAARVSRRTAEQELGVLHDAGWIIVHGIWSVPGRRTFGGEITLPAIKNGWPLEPSAEVVRLLGYMDAWQVSSSLESLAQRMLYIYLCSHPGTRWNHRQDQRYSPKVQRYATTLEWVSEATGMHRVTVRDAKKELIREGLVYVNAGDELSITDPASVGKVLHHMRERARG